MNITWRKRKRGAATYQTQIGSKKKSSKSPKISFGKYAPLKSDSRQQLGGSMVRELNFLTVGFVFAFLAAIVIGVF